MRVIGRDEELALGDAFIDAALVGPARLVIEGTPGIGKTTLWAEIARRAGARGCRVLVAAPAAAEAALTLTTFADLVGPVVDEVISALPTPQARAVDAALLRAEPVPGGQAPRLLGTALQSILAELARDAPVVLALDDIQWADPASAATIDFAVRRLAGGIARAVSGWDAAPAASGGVSLVVGHRRGEAMPIQVTRTGDEWSRALAVGPLSVAALHHVLAAALGRAPTRSTLVRVHAASGGNPLFALEIARLLARDGEPPAGAPLPVPADVREIVRQRIAELPTGTLETLLTAASSGPVSPATIGAALGRDVGPDLSVATAADVVRVRDDRVVFAHPLYPAAIQAEATDGERRRVHGLLADIATDVESRARHHALAAPGPDAAVADELAAASAATAGRGAPAAAAELMTIAVERTPTDRPGEAAVRSIRLAEYLKRSGDLDRAAIVIEATIERTSGASRARAMLELAGIRWEAGSLESVPLCEAALDEAVNDPAGADPELVALAHATLAAVDWEDFSRGEAHASAALELLAPVTNPDPRVLGLALLVRCSADQHAGRPIDPAMIERGLACEARAPAPSVSDRFSAALGTWLKYADDFDGARTWLERTWADAVAEGDEGSLPFAISHIPELELWTGDWPRALEAAERHLRLSIEQGLENQRRQALYNLALVHVHLGDGEVARVEIAEALQAAEDGDTWTRSSVLPLVGMLELSAGRPTEATAPMLEATSLRDQIGHERPRRMDADLVAALVATGRMAEAGAIRDAMADRADRFGRHSARALVARANALVEAASGDLEGAESSLQRALDEHDAAPIPFDRARTLLVLGQVHRRRRERALAKVSFEEALATFDRLGARLWAERARGELGRTGIRRASATGLTETEDRVARLAASGMTNREVAAALFISVRTVEANLARAYDKLGIRSRAELGARMAPHEDPAQT